MQKIITHLKFTTGSILEFMILKMLSEHTYSTEEMYETLKTVGFKTPMGSLYPLLTKFRRNNYVQMGFEEGDTVIVIKTYAITDKGREKLLDFKRDWKRLNSLIASIGAR